MVDAGADMMRTDRKTAEQLVFVPLLRESAEHIHFLLLMDGGYTLYSCNINAMVFLVFFRITKVTAENISFQRE